MVRLGREAPRVSFRAVKARSSPAAAPGDGAALAAALAGALGVAAFLSWLTYGREPAGAGPAWVGALPALAASANAASAAALGAGWRAIRRRRIDRHRRCMLAAVAFSGVFFAAYVVRHHYHGDTPFGGTGPARALYLAMLATHVLGSVAVLVLLPLTLRFAALRRFDSHRALNRWLLPVWLYVSVTGVCVYLALRAAPGSAG
jgi:putative membrane protein